MDSDCGVNLIALFGLNGEIKDSAEKLKGVKLKRKTCNDGQKLHVYLLFK